MLHFMPFGGKNDWLFLQPNFYELAMIALVDDAELMDDDKKIILKFKRGSIIVKVDKQNNYLYDPRDVTYRDKAWTSKKP